MHFLQVIKDAGYSEYDIAKVKYFYRILTAEISKLLVFTVIWWWQGLLFQFFMGISVFFLLRICSGGLHFKTYWTCFAFSFFYLFLCINWLPKILLSRIPKLFFLFLCIILNSIFSPVVSKYRVPPSKSKKKKSKRRIFIIVFLYLIFMYITPQSHLIDIGFWCIVIHTLQLGVAYFMKRRKKHGTLEKRNG